MITAIAAAAALACASETTPPEVISAAQLVAMRNLAAPSLSPDGTRVAFQVQHANPVTNSYASTWCVTSTIVNSAPVAIGDGGDIVLAMLPGRQRPTGSWQTLTPRWSPDQQWLGFLAQRGGEIRIEMCRTDGSGCRRVINTSGSADFVWAGDGATLIFQVDAAAEATRRDRTREGLSGYLFDDRFDVSSSFAPIRSSVAANLKTRVIEIVSGVERAASENETAYFLGTRRSGFPELVGTSLSITVSSVGPVDRPAALRDRAVRDFERLGQDGAVWVEPFPPELAGLYPPLRLFAARNASGIGIQRCDSDLCTGRIIEFHPTPDGKRVFFIRRSGWGGSHFDLGLWDLTTNRATLLLTGDEAFRSCGTLDDRAICLSEGPTTPRHIISINYATATTRNVFDPNSNIAPHAFVGARKLEWTSTSGDQVFGYLLEPPGRKPSQRVPLIVVQYRATGFLRGGVGDEFPIQAFVRRGFAVLVLERPDETDLLSRIANPLELERESLRNLSERQRLLGALTAGIKRVVDLGVADGMKVGLTGVSDGAQTTSFALIHCRCAAAAAVSTAFDDPLFYYLIPSDRRSVWASTGLGPWPVAGTKWRDLSLALNVEKIDTPILAQVADRELLFMLQTQRVFTDARRPFDLYVFPDEYHVKWQPRHRLAVYRRNLDWFSFWLQGVEDPSPAKVEQYQRWRAMRTVRAKPADAGRE